MPTHRAFRRHFRAVRRLLAKRSGAWSRGAVRVRPGLAAEVAARYQLGDLLNVVECSRENLLLAEDYIAREKLGEEGSDPTAPPAAGE